MEKDRFQAWLKYLKMDYQLNYFSLKTFKQLYYDNLKLEKITKDDPLSQLTVHLNSEPKT